MFNFSPLNGRCWPFCPQNGGNQNDPKVEEMMIDDDLDNDDEDDNNDNEVEGMMMMMIMKLKV